MARPDDGRKRTWRFRLNDKTTLEVSAPQGATEKQVRRRGRVSLVLGSLIAALAVAAVAYVDNLITQDLVTNGNATATRLGGGNAEVYVHQTGGACDANGDQINVASNQAWLAIAAPGYVNVTGCEEANAETIAYSVTAAAPLGGVATVTGSENVNDTQISTGPNSDFDVRVVPRAPTFTTTSKTSSSITLNWNLSADDADISDYQLESGSSMAGPFALLASPSKGTTTFTDSPLAAETTRCYQLRARFQAAGVGEVFSARMNLALISFKK